MIKRQLFAVLGLAMCITRAFASEPGTCNPSDMLKEFPGYMNTHEWGFWRSVDAMGGWPTDRLTHWKTRVWNEQERRWDYIDPKNDKRMKNRLLSP